MEAYSMVRQNDQEANDVSLPTINKEDSWDQSNNSNVNSRSVVFPPKEQMKLVESLDYKQIDNEPQKEFNQLKVLHPQDRQRVAAKWLIYIVLGILLGVIAFGIKKAIDALQEVKFRHVGNYMAQNQNFVAFLVYYGFNTLYAFISCGVVLLAGPLAGGSGIPEIKGYLNGVRIVHTINLKTFVAKIISIVFAFSSCLALGPEGPMVHIGSMLGGGLAAAKSSTLKIRLPGATIFEKLRSHRDQRDFISSGAAAGIAAAFGAPIGGVLFALEEASSVWSRELTWRTFLGCMLSAFTVNLLFQSISDGDSMVNDYGLLSFGISRDYLYRYQELNLFILLGVIGGLLGTLFVKLNVKLNMWRRDKFGARKLPRLIEVFVVVTISSCLSFGIPALVSCRPMGSISYYPAFCDNNKISNSSLTLTNLYCNTETSSYNDFANLFILPQDKVLKLLFSRTHELFTMSSLNVFLVIYFGLVTITAGISVSAGLFVPMLIIGATFGRIIGRIVSAVFSGLNPPIDTSIYALVGSAAMMSGFSRTTISLCVILIELTENTQFLLPIMLAVTCAKWVGDTFSKSIYDELMELKSIPHLEPHPPHYSYLSSVTDVMATPVVCINEMEGLKRIIEILRTTKHNGFPVVKKVSEERKYVWCGLVLRKQLLILLDTKKYQERSSRITPEVLDYHTYIQLMNHTWDLNKIDLPSAASLNDYVLDVRPYMDKSQVVVSDKFSFVDAYKLFQSQSLRHLPVVNEDNNVVGIITRKDLLHLPMNVHEQ